MLNTFGTALRLYEFKFGNTVAKNIPETDEIYCDFSFLLYSQLGPNYFILIVTEVKML